MSIRRGIPHLFSTKTPKGNMTPALSDAEFKSIFTNDGHVFLDYTCITEKTDGFTFLFGYDKSGFYSQTSGSGNELMRLGQDYINRAETRGNNMVIARAVAEFHDSMLNETRVPVVLEKEFQQRGSVSVRGEVFINALSKSGPDDTLIYNKIPYAPFGSVGGFVLHSKLPENEWLKDHLRLSDCSNRAIHIDCDDLYFPEVYVDCADIVQRIGWQENLYPLRLETYKRLFEAVVTNSSPNWGDEVEGWVIHPYKDQPDRPTFKLITKSFSERTGHGW